MLLETFLEEYNGVPWDLFQVAGIASDVQDDKALVIAAQNFEDAYYDFETELERISFELG